MSLITKVLKQKAVWWSVLRTDDNGKDVYDNPVEIKCRWEDVHEAFLDGTGATQISNAKVMVDRDIKGGVLWQGELEDVLSINDPFKNIGAYPIKKFEKMPKLNAKEFLRTVML